MKLTIHKALKWLNWTILLPLLTVLLLLVILLYSNPGLHFSLWLSQKFAPQLTVSQHSGSLLGGMQLKGVSWQDDAYQLQLADVKLEVDNSCFFQLKICVQALSITDATILLGNNTLRFSQFTTSAEALGRQIQFNKTQLHQLQIEPGEVESSPAEPFSYIPPQLADITLPFTLFINGFELTDASMVQQGNVTSLPDVTLSLQIREQNIRLLDLQAHHPMASLSATAELTTQGNYPLSARISTLLKKAPYAGQQLNVSLSGNLADLAVNIKAQGQYNANADAHLAILDPGLPLNINVSYDALRWPAQSDDAWQIDPGSLTASGNLQQIDFTINAGLAKSKVPHIGITAEGKYQLSETLLNVSQFTIATLKGNVTGNASVAHGANVTWQTELNLKSITPGSFWPQLTGELNGNLANSGSFDADGSWQTELNQLAIQGNLLDEMINISGSVAASFQHSANRYQIDSKQLVFQHGDNQITLTGSLAEQWQLDANVDIPDLTSSIPSASGVISGRIAVRGAQRQPEVTASIDASALRYAGDRLEQLTVDLQLQQHDQLQASIKLSASDGRVAGFQLELLELTGAGNESQHSLNMALQSPLSDIMLDLSGQLQDRKRWQGQLKQAEVGSPLGNWQLQQAVDLQYTVDKQLVSISKHCWQQQSGSLCLTENASLSPQSMAANIELSQLNLASLDRFLPLAMNLQGTLNAKAIANWQPGQQPRFNVNVQSDNGSLIQRAESPISLQWQQLRINSEVKDDKLTANILTTLNEQAKLTSELTILSLSANNRPLSASMQLTEFTLDFLQPLLDEYSELAGVISADIRANGSVENPMLAGQLVLEQLRVKGKLAPTDINNGKLKVDFNGAQADLTGDIVTPQGNLTLNGVANWQQLEDWRLKLLVKGDPLSVQISQGKLQIKPDLEISANPQLAKVTGTVTIPTADIQIDELPQNAIGVSNDTVILTAEREPITKQQGMTIPLEASIKVELGQAVSLEAFGLETLLRGNLQVQQRQNKQTINGELRLVDGTFRSYGQDLLIRKGKMTFNGPPDQPYLNIEAIRNPANMEDSVIAGLRVTGPADRPQVTIFSEPAMPQANALSYILAGRDLDSESGSAANAVTTSLIGMSIASSGSVVGDIGKAFGVSDLTLDTTGAGDNSQVTVSGYLNRDLQIKYGIGIFEPIGEFTLRYRLMQSLYLEAVSGLDNAVDLLYRFEFD